MFLRLAVLLIVFSCSDSDDKSQKQVDPKKIDKVIKKGTIVATTKDGYQIANASIVYDLDTKTTTVSSKAWQGDKPKSGLNMEYILFCGDARYLALEVKLKAQTNSDGEAIASKKSLRLDSNNAGRCELKVIVDYESLLLIEGEPRERMKMGAVYELTLEDTLWGGFSSKWGIVFSADDKPSIPSAIYVNDNCNVKNLSGKENDEQKRKCLQGKKFKIMLLPNSDKTWERAGYLGGMSVIEHNPNVTQLANQKAGALTGCTSDTCWKYYYRCWNDNTIKLEAWSNGQVPGSEPDNNKDNMSCDRIWLQKTDEGLYRLWQFVRG